MQGTPIFEENGPDKFKGIDIMRAVRSFDPCLPCGVHMFLGNGTHARCSAPADVRYSRNLSCRRVRSRFEESGRESDMSQDGLGPKQIARIEELVHEIEALPDPNSRATAAELVQLLMDFYGQGLARMLAIAGKAGSVKADSAEAASSTPSPATRWSRSS